MKRIVLIALLALLLVGCGKHEAKITGGDEVIWKSKKVTYTKEQLNEDLKIKDYTSVILTEILDEVALKENINIEEIKTEIEKQVQELYDQGYESYILSYYGSKESYIEQSVSSKIIEKLMENEANENYDKYKEEQKAYKAEVAYFDTKDAAQKVIDSVNNDSNTFAYAASENGYTGTIEETVYVEESDLPVEVKEAIAKVEKGLTSIVETSTTATSAEGESTVTPRYYVVNVISKNSDDFKEDFVTYLKSNVLTTEQIINKCVEKYNITVHDQNTYKLLKDTYEAFK